MIFQKTLACLTTFSLLLGLKISTVQAATFTVTTSADSGEGSLRQAILDANAAPDEDEVVFLPDVTGIITLSGGELVITQNLSLVGPGIDKLTISGGNASRIFNIKSGSVSLSHLKLSDGKVVGEEGQAGKSDLSGSTTGFKAGPGERGGEAQGGAIFNAGTLSLNNVLLSNNSVQGGKGGTGGLGYQGNAMGNILPSLTEMEEEVVTAWEGRSTILGHSISSTLLSPVTKLKAEEEEMEGEVSKSQIL